MVRGWEEEMTNDWTERRPEVIELTKALEMFFRERNADPAIAHQALVNMLVTTTMMLDDGCSPNKANKKLAAYFRDVATHLHAMH
jgi:hypothetical protein